MASKREQKYREAQRRRGMKHVRVWIPESRVEALKLIAEQWRKEHNNQLKPGLEKLIRNSTD